MSQSFPSLTIRSNALIPQGAFAEAQAEYLNPDASSVAELARVCAAKNIGIVAHFYMDVELQGVLASCDWPHIYISDSLAMADKAVKMAEAGVKTVVVLGVDFMSENVRAVLDAAGHSDVAVYRVAREEIGCSLAESAEAPAYMNWLDHAAETSEHGLHVVYINTSLITKAQAHLKVPTITCTSSNVLQTMLTAASEIPDVEIWYGPDTYMGHNLDVMLKQYATLSDDEIRAIHPAHDRASIASLIERYHYFRQGACVVHHLFGEEVADQVRTDYADAYHTAHLEVPGEMFELAVEAQRNGRGVVGSTSNILGFIAGKVDARIAAGDNTPVRVVLGTEAGMITAIVNKVQEKLRASGAELEVEVIFPVASEAIAETDDQALSIIPGVAGGEGCSTAGGCATCPFMKMNSLDALLEVLGALGERPASDLVAYEPRKYSEDLGGRSAADVGSEPILYMRHFQRTGSMDPALIGQVQA